MFKLGRYFKKQSHEHALRKKMFNKYKMQLKHTTGVCVADNRRLK